MIFHSLELAILDYIANQGYLQVNFKIMPEIRALLVPVQPFGFTAANTCTQTAIPAVWRPLHSGSHCKRSGTPRGIVTG